MGWTYNPETDEIDYYVGDHGGLDGLLDDDHTQYLLAAGSRALTGSWDAGSFEIRAQTFQSDVAAGTAPFVVASNTLVSNLNADLWDGYQFVDYLDQAVTQASSPVFVTVKLSGLTDGYVPYHVSDATGLANGPIWTDGTKVGIGTITVPHAGVGLAKFALEGTDSSNAAGPHIQITTGADNYPLVQLVSYAHGNLLLFFDGYYDGTVRSSYASGTYLIQKSVGQLSILVGAAAAGAGVSVTKRVWIEKRGLTYDLCYANYAHIADPTDADAFMFYYGFGHDNAGYVFDAWWNGTNWIASDTTQFFLWKSGDRLSVLYQNSSTKGNPITTGFWIQDALCISSTGLVGVGLNTEAAGNARFEVEDGATAASIIVKITQDDANVYGLCIGNDTYSTTDTLSLSLSLDNSGNGLIANLAAGDLILRAGGTANASDIYLRAEDKIYIQDYNAGTPATKATWDVINGRLGIGMAPAAGLLQVGDGTNYSEVEADGTLKFAGTATVWKDINLGAAQLGQPASGAPSAEKWIDEAAGDTGIYTLAFALNEYVSGSFEMQHDYKEGSDITFHVHYGGITAPAGGTDNVKWELTYTIARDGNTINAVTVITAEAAFTVQYRLERINFTAITGSTGGVDGGNIKIGDQFLFKLKRVAASADDYAGDAYLATAGLHYEIDTVGSRTIGAK